MIQAGTELKLLLDDMESELGAVFALETGAASVVDWHRCSSVFSACGDVFECCVRFLVSHTAFDEAELDEASDKVMSAGRRTASQPNRCVTTKRTCVLL